MWPICYWVGVRALILLIFVILHFSLSHLRYLDILSHSAELLLKALILFMFSLTRHSDFKFWIGNAMEADWTIADKCQEKNGSQLSSKSIDKSIPLK